MKTITINVSEPVYRDFQEFARKHDRKTSELIRDAMALYREQRFGRKTSLREIRPVSAGKVLKPWSAEDDLLGEMLEDARI